MIVFTNKNELKDKLSNDHFLYYPKLLVHKYKNNKFNYFNYFFYAVGSSSITTIKTQKKIIIN